MVVTLGQQYRVREKPTVILLRGPSFNRYSICKRPDSHTCFFFLFVYMEMSPFPSIFFVPLPFPLCMESTSYVFSFRVVFFRPCDHGPNI